MHTYKYEQYDGSIVFTKKRTYIDWDYCNLCKCDQLHTIHEGYVKAQDYWEEWKTTCTICGNTNYV